MKQSYKLLGLIACVLLIAGTSSAQMNYNFAWTTGPVVAATPGNPLTWTTTTANDEEYSAATNIFADGAPFTFAGTAFTQFQASTNGFIRLGTGLVSATAADALSGTLRSIIAPLWDDLAVGTTATDITYAYAGVSGSQILRVSWTNMKWNKTAAAANMEFTLKLYEGTNVIEFIYSVAGTPTAGSASIGLADNTVISSAGSATGKFYSINVGGTIGSRQYHESMGYTFNGIANAPDAGTTMTFTPVTPTPYAAGTYHVAGGVPFFSGLSDAAMALNVNGVSGAVILEVADGSYDDVFHLLNVPGASSTNTITLKPSPGASVTVSPRNGSQTTTGPGTTAGDHIIRLDGTQYVTIDGFSLADNANNTTTATKFEVGAGIYTPHLNGAITGGTRFNTLKNLSIDMKVNAGAVNAGATGIRTGTFNSTETDTSKANSYNTIQNVNITGIWRSGIRLFGVSRTNPDRGNTITAVSGRNTIGNVAIITGSSLDMRIVEFDCQNNFTLEKTDIVNISNAVNTSNNIYVIVMGLGSGTRQNSASGGLIKISDVTISGVTLTAATTGSIMGIFSTQDVDDGIEYQISGCKLTNFSSSTTSTGTVRGVVIAPDSATGKTAKIWNNFVSDLKCAGGTGTPAVRGIDVQGNTSAGTFPLTAQVYYNTIYLDNSVPPTNAAHRSACVYWANFGTSSLDLRNNILTNLMSTTTGFSPALYPSANSNLLRLASTTDFNLYYAGAPSAAKPITYDGTTSFQTLADHQAAVASGGPRDVNARSVAVTFVSAADLHLSGGSLGDANLKGTPIATYTTDIDGQTRDTQAPYMGADEASPALPVQLASFTAQQRNAIVLLQWRTLSEINNYGFYVHKRRVGERTWNEIAGSFVAGNGTTNEPHDYSYTDNSITGGAWQYRLKQVDLDNTVNYSEPIQLDIVTSVAGTTPTTYSLEQNFPNPFNPSTTIRFEIAKPELVSLKVYDMLGREVATLANEQIPAGRYSLSFYGSNLASGTYIYRLQAGSYVATKKMSLMK